MKIIKQDLEIYICDIKTCSIDWYKNHRLHREDGPAIIWTDEYYTYYLNGKSYFKGKDDYWKKVHANY